MYTPGLFEYIFLQFHLVLLLMSIHHVVEVHISSDATVSNPMLHAVCTVLNCKLRATPKLGVVIVANTVAANSSI